VGGRQVDNYTSVTEELNSGLPRRTPVIIIIIIIIIIISIIIVVKIAAV